MYLIATVLFVIGCCLLYVLAEIRDELWEINRLAQDRWDDELLDEKLKKSKKRL